MDKSDKAKIEQLEARITALETKTRGELEILRDQIRLYALEILVVNEFAISLLTKVDDPLQRLEKCRQQLIEGARAHRFQRDAAESDYASGELEDAVDRLMEMVSGQINAALEARRKKGS
jgi:hypothetical protein